MERKPLKHSPFKRNPGTGIKKTSILRRTALKRPLEGAKKPKIGKGVKKKALSLTKLKKKLDTIFSLYIRTRDQGQCYTCPRKDEIKKMQNGHFVPRQYLSVRWDETNNHCQCYACNMLYNGQPGAYAVRLELDYGPGTVARLESRRKELTKLTLEWYEEQIAIFAAKYKAILAAGDNTLPRTESM